MQRGALDLTVKCAGSVSTTVLGFSSQVTLDFNLSIRKEKVHNSESNILLKFMFFFVIWHPEADNSKVNRP